jgi:serine/threonine protein phosphatase 1
MPKFFIFSDCHGYANELKTALDQAGFDPNNQEHWLIGVGDYLDRGRQPQEIIDFLMNLDRVKLVKGNHNILLMQCISRGYTEYYDWHNGTAQTIIDLAPEAQTFQEACNVAYEKIKDFTGSMVNYVELKEHIFVHSWIPLKYDGTFNHDWRNATQEEWDNSMWSNPFELAEQGLLPPDKTLVFGHFHTSYPRRKYECKPELGPEADFSIYYGNRYIGIDACVYYSGKINVLVLEDEFMEE